jgi:hypothetical protein
MPTHCWQYAAVVKKLAHHLYGFCVCVEHHISLAKLDFCFTHGLCVIRTVQNIAFTMTFIAAVFGTKTNNDIVYYI